MVKSLPAMWETWVRSLGSIPGLGRSPGGGRGNPLQYSCLENPHGQRSLSGSQRVRHDSTTKQQQNPALEELTFSRFINVGKYRSIAGFGRTFKDHSTLICLVYWETMWR